VTWREVEQGFAIEDFRMDNALRRIRKLGDLWLPLLAPRSRVDLAPLIDR